MRRPIIRKGINASIGSAKLIWLMEKRLAIARHGLDIALDFGLDVLAKTCTIEIIRTVLELKEKGGNYGTSLSDL